MLSHQNIHSLLVNNEQYSLIINKSSTLRFPYLLQPTAYFEKFTLVFRAKYQPYLYPE